MAEQRDRRDNPWEADLDPNSPARAFEGLGAASQGVPPRHVGGAPGYGAHGMGYGPQSTSQTGSFGAYGLAREAAQDYTAVSRSHGSGQFDAPHGTLPYGWDGAFGSQGEFSSPADRLRPREHPLGSGGSGATRSGTQAQQQRRTQPKNYRRSDERIHEDIYERLSGDARIDPSDVTVEVKGGAVTLHGTVAHRQMKHWIEDVVADCPGVNDVDNKLRVAFVAAWPPDRGRV